MQNGPARILDADIQLGPGFSVPVETNIANRGMALAEIPYRNLPVVDDDQLPVRISLALEIA